MLVAEASNSSNTLISVLESASAKVRHTAVKTVNMVSIFLGTTRGGY